MPKTKFQGFIFSVLMAYSMTLGMEIYNQGIKYGLMGMPGSFSNLTYEILGHALFQTTFMALFAILFSYLWGTKFGANFAAKHTDPKRDNPYIIKLFRQCGTMAVMCPSMSFAAALLWNIIVAGNPVSQLPVIWIGTVIKNFPAAFLWNIFAAGPFTNWAFGKLFLREPKKSKKEDAIYVPAKDET